MADPEPGMWSALVWGPLVDDLVSLAMADDEGAVDGLLTRITVAAADTISGVDYASITAWRGAGYTTVAASSEMARAVDDAQHAEEAGPCVLAAETAMPVIVSDIGTTMSWPGFYRQANGLGLRMSVSVPLFAADGLAVGVLNLYSRRAASLNGLMTGVRDVFAAEWIPAGGFAADVDAGARQFLVGLAQALHVRATIQRAVGVLMARDGGDAGPAYRRLRDQAVASNASLSTVARRAIAAVMASHEAAVWVTEFRGIDGGTRVVLGGELAAPVDTAVVVRLAALAVRPPARLDLDLSEAQFCDVHGLRILAEVCEQATAAGSGWWPPRRRCVCCCS